MEYENITYKGFCWSLGTTSFRTKNFNLKIEQQLQLLDEFWSLPDNKEVPWQNNNTIQEQYYLFMQEKGFVKGDAPRKDKDAREKTSGLVDIGLIDENRRLTNAGKALLEISISGDFSSNNSLQIPKDSFLYFKQLLKTSCNVSEDTVRPYIVLNYILSKVEYLSLEEFKFLLPFCTTKNNTEEIINGILAIREGTVTVDDIIISKIMGMTNYQIALRMLKTSAVVDELLICHIGLNRKSRDYDKIYFELYKWLEIAYFGHDDNALPKVYETARKVNIGRYWIKYLFNTTSKKAIEKNPQKCKNATAFDNIKTNEEFRTVFFKTMHLFKTKATLSDYYDLNRRYFKITDTVIFDDGKVYLDIVPKQFLSSVANELFECAFITSGNLSNNCELTEIAPCLVIKEETIISGINHELGLNISSMSEARQAVMDERHKRFNELIDSRFDDDTLISLLDKFESRNDDEILSLVTDNADVPTIFEYILGIIWYKVSERKGNILEYMNLSLEADLLPRTHAGGGEADIEYWYEACPDYPAHCMILEATLADGTNQRRMEMEPVSRHLGEHILKHENNNSYCVFSTTYLDRNVISDFRNRKTFSYYNKDFTKSVDGLKIIPLQTAELKTIIRNGLNYRTLYTIFDNAFNSTEPVPTWYSHTIINKI